MTDVPWTTRVAVVVGLALLLMSAGLGWRVYDSLVDQLATKDEQVIALRARAVAAEGRAADAEARADAAVDRARVERDQQRALTCDRFDDLARFAATVAIIIQSAAEISEEQRAALDEFVTPRPRPEECPPP